MQIRNRYRDTNFTAISLVSPYMMDIICKPYSFFQSFIILLLSFHLVISLSANKYKRSNMPKTIMVP